ncbi:MAG: type pilus biosis protein PilN [Deltaproteobacteria bacterium]|jgi:type IV pilus assembly protein PilN|nr:type pilus biosis protein PilN [Deltaproteobacteria bacterium]
MIRINLLPKKVQKQALKTDLILFFFMLVLSGALAGGIYLNNTRTIAALKGELGRTKQAITGMDQFYKEYLALEKQKKEMQTRISVLEKIREGRALAARMLYDLPSIVKESVWVKRFKKEEDRFDLEGRAFENESVSEFVEKLSKLPYARNVELRVVEDVTEEGVVVKKFTVQGNLSL